MSWKPRIEWSVGFEVGMLSLGSLNLGFAVWSLWHGGGVQVMSIIAAILCFVHGGVHLENRLSRRLEAQVKDLGALGSKVDGPHAEQHQ